MPVSCVEVKRPIPAAVEWAIKIRDGMRGAKRGIYRETLLVMATYVNRRGECFPSIRTLAAALGLTYDGMRRRIRSMVRLGLIQSCKRFGDNGRRTSNGYVITLSCQSTPPGTVAYRDNITPQGEAGGECWAAPVQAAPSPPGTPVGDRPASPPPSPPELASQEESRMARASNWVWRKRAWSKPFVVPVDGEARPVGTVVSEVHNARETFGFSFLAHILGCNEQEGDQ